MKQVTLRINERLLRRAHALGRLADPSRLVNRSLRYLIALEESARRLEDTGVTRAHMAKVAAGHRAALRRMPKAIILDDQLVREAQRITGITEKTRLLNDGLRSLIAQASARRLAALGATMPRATAAPRRRRGKAG